MRVQTVFSEPITPAYSEEYMMPTGIEEDQTYSLDHIIRFLRQHKNEVHEMRRQQKQLEKELDERERECKRLERENYEMRMQLDHVENDYQSVNDDYRMHANNGTSSQKGLDGGATFSETLQHRKPT